MEQLFVSLVIAAVEAIPKVIDAINASSLSAEEKQKLLAELGRRMTDANAKVAAVTFKEVGDAPG